MKALTVRQPWATAIALGVKCVETRAWRTQYRGRIAIHAAKGMPRSNREFATKEQRRGLLPEGALPLGVVVCTARIADCIPAEEAVRMICATEKRYGDYSTGRWAWLLEDVRALKRPVPARGALGLWEWRR